MFSINDLDIEKSIIEKVYVKYRRILEVACNTYENQIEDYYRFASVSRLFVGI